MKNSRLLSVVLVVASLFFWKCNKAVKTEEPIKAFCVDFNWECPWTWSFAKPGDFADTDPAEQIRWYKELGANTVQTFCVSSNGYAWYKNGIVPEQPGLKHDYLKEMVRLGHQEHMRIMGYFTIGSNPRWGKENPDFSYGCSPIMQQGKPHNCHIPYTDRYLSYLDSAVRDVISKTDIDGFMLDWLWQPLRESTNGKWIECEKKLFEQLMGKPFPGEDNLSDSEEVAYSRKAIDRCWETVRKAAKETKPSCILWLSCNNPKHPHVQNSILFKQIDWLMNEAGDLESINAVKSMIGPNTTLVTCLAAWNKMDAVKLIPDAMKNNIGLYGFIPPKCYKPVSYFLSMPVDSFRDDERNTAALARAYNNLPMDYVK